MSRVDEALRRAATLAAGAALPAPTPGLDDDPDQPPVRPAPEPVESRRRWPTPAAAAPSAEPTVPIFAELSLEGLDRGLARKVVIDRDMLPASREQYRRLAATLHQAQATSGLRVVLVASALAGEGKTLTAANVALTFSESYHRKVLLIDGDLRRPSIDQLFRIDPAPGLNEGLTAPVERMLAVRAVTPRLMVLPAGRATPDPIAGLTSDRMRRLIDEARGSFDWVIIDTPPVGLLPDANLLAAMADGAVLVIRAAATPYDLVQRAVDALGKERILGVVLNRAPEPPDQAYQYTHYYAMPSPRRAD